MKAQHRHELHTNLLADRMGRLVEGMKSAPRSTSMLIWVFVVLGVVVLAVWQYASSASVTNSSALWLGVNEALQDAEAGPRKLGLLAENNSGTLAGRAARFEFARRRFQEGQASMTALGRGDDVARLVVARAEYEELLNRCADQPLLEQEALMALAKAEESLAGASLVDKPDKRLGSLDRALEYYDRLAKKYPSSFLGEAARKRRDYLQSPENRASVDTFYNDLHQRLAPRPRIDSEFKASPSTTELK